MNTTVAVPLAKAQQQIERYHLQTTTSRRAVKSEDTRVKLRVQEEVTIKAREVTETATPQLFLPQPDVWESSGPRLAASLSSKQITAELKPFSILITDSATNTNREMLSKPSESAAALFSQVFYLKTAYYKDHQMERETTSAGGSAIIHSKLNWLGILNTHNLENKSRTTAPTSSIAGMGGRTAQAPLLAV